MQPLHADAVAPCDDATVELLNRVHPPTWRNPQPAAKYDLVVLGGGTAGLVSGTGAAGLGARVALQEANRPAPARSWGAGDASLTGVKRAALRPTICVRVCSGAVTQ
jgi:ribulose 1,5-bisphosphate synthetase/thiazole synthase